MDSIVAASQPGNETDFDTQRITTAVNALAEKHAGSSGIRAAYAMGIDK